jgi:hypothetical protein
MKALLIAAVTGVAMGAAAGATVRLPPPEQLPTADFQTAAVSDDPGVALHRLMMGAEPWEAPQPYVRVSYPALAEAWAPPELADLTLADLRVAYRPPAPAEDEPNTALPAGEDEQSGLELAALAP